MAAYKGLLLVIVGARREPTMLKRATMVAKALNLDAFVYAPVAQPLLPRGFLADTPLFSDNRSQTNNIHQMELDNALTVLRSHGINAEGAIEWQGDVVEGILKVVKAKTPAIVMAAHQRHTGIAEHMLTDDDLNLVRLCPAPLWLVRGRAWPEQPSIVAAIDPLHHGDKDVLVDDLILTTAADIAKALQSTAHALHTIPGAQSVASQLSGAFLPEQVDTLQKQIDKYHADEVYRLTEAHGFDKSVVHLDKNRNVVEALDQLGKPLQVALVVLGALSRNPLKHMLLGGTADRVLRKLRVDVLVVKPPEPRS
jgi:universal stress protein E